MEITTGLTVLGTGIMSAKVIEKILGPTAEYVGEGLKNWTKKRLENLSRIFVKAEKKLGDRVETEGAVPPRVLKGILNEGSFCDDELSAEYFGGVLASSRTDRKKDDRGTTLINLLSSMSTYQIRTHYIFYSLLRTTLQPYSSVISPGVDRQLMQIYVPTNQYYSAMDIETEFSNADDRLGILAHSINGLKRLELVTQFMFGAPEYFRAYPRRSEFAEHGIAFKPTPSGMELYLWAYGLGHINHFQFLSAEEEFDPIPDVKLPGKVIILYKGIFEKRAKAIKAQT